MPYGNYTYLRCPPYKNERVTKLIICSLRLKSTRIDPILSIKIQSQSENSCILSPLNAGSENSNTVTFAGMFNYMVYS